MGDNPRNRKSGKKGPDFVQTFARAFSLKVLLRPIEKLGISANQTTVLNFFLVNLPAVYFFSKGDYRNNLIALGFCLFSGLVDYIDGALARKKGIDSSFGEWLDSTLDSVWQIMLLCGISLGVYLASHMALFWLIIGFSAITGMVVSNYISREFHDRYKLDLYKDMEGLNAVFEKERLAPIDRFYANIAAPGNFTFVLFFTMRYLITLGALFNLMHWALFIIAAASIIKSIVLFYIFVLYARFGEGKKVNHDKLVDLLNQFVRGKSSS